MRSGTSSAVRSLGSTTRCDIRRRFNFHALPNFSTRSNKCPIAAQTMPRTLPWLTGAESNDATPRKRAIKSQPDSDSDHDRTPKASKKAAVDFEKSDILRSSSPPTQSIRRCPSEEYLIEGFDNDDIYMMVEDEFYAVAQRFTQHLHYAEYVRRTKEVKSQNAARIGDIARPTDGITPISEETKKKEEAEALAARQKAGLEQVQETTGQGEGNDDNDDDDDDDMWAGTSLQDLMTSPRKARSLVGGARGIKSGTRAAAGYVQTSQNSATTAGLLPSSSPLGHREQERQHQAVLDETASEDDDDLDVQPTTTFKRTVHDIKTPKPEPKTENKSNISSIAPTKSIPANNSMRNPEKAKQTPSINAINKTQSVSKPRKKLLFDDFDELPEPKSNLSMQEQKSKSSSSISRTPSGSRSGDNKESKKSRLNEVPMFLL